MSRFLSNVVARHIDLVKRVRTDLQVELLRKSIHILIALVPALAALNSSLTMIMLGTGIILYTASETMRLKGMKIAVISAVTIAASRDRDKGRFVLGPVTLGLGAMAALLFYPEPAASIAIYALAFGDSLSSIIGRLFGIVKIPFLKGKTLSGSFACLAAVTLVTFWITGNSQVSVLIGTTAMVLEAMPTGDMDNILIPIGTGFITCMLIG